MTTLLLAVISCGNVHGQEGLWVDPVDRRIDSVLASDPTGFGLQVDSLPARGIAPPQALPGYSQRTASRSDLTRSGVARSLPSYTSAEGFVLFVGNREFSPVVVGQSFRLGLSAGGGFAFAARRWEWRGAIAAEFLDADRPLRLTVEGHDLVDSRDAWKCSDLESTFAALVAGVDPMNCYAIRRGISTEVLLCVTPGVGFGAIASFDDYSRASRRAEWSLFGPDHPFDTITQAQAGQLVSLTPRITVGLQDDGAGSGTGVRFGAEARVELGRMGSNEFHQATIDARARWWAVTGRISVAGHMRVVWSDGVLPAQRQLAFGGFGSIPAMPLNAFRSRSGTFWTLEFLTRPFAEMRSRFVEDLALVVQADWCALPVAGNRDDIHGGIGCYVASATGAMRAGIAIPTDGESAIRFAMRLERPF